MYSVICKHTDKLVRLYIFYDSRSFQDILAFQALQLIFLCKFILVVAFPSINMFVLYISRVAVFQVTCVSLLV